jgi:peptide-methionine (S)-S-oxide reductase
MLSMLFRNKTRMIARDEALPGRPGPIPTAETHHVTGRPLHGPMPPGMDEMLVGMGCFWGAERLFWRLPGVWVTAVGYAGGFTPNPTYEEVCSGRTGHAEAVRIVFDPREIGYRTLLAAFWEGHDPTQGMRQGNDVGTQYRSALYTFGPQQAAAARASADAYGERLRAAGLGPLTTEIVPAPAFYFAEAYHQQYLSKNPGGYCGLGGTGVACPTGAAV